MRRSNGPVLLAIAAVLLSCVPVGLPASADEGRGSAPFEEVGRLPLLAGPEFTDDQASRSGWLILDTTARRAYQVFEKYLPTETVIQSFDLDTLRPRRRVILQGSPVQGGTSQSAASGSNSRAGEVVHAVDESAGRLYLAMSNEGLTSAGAASGAADGRRPLARFVMLDEDALDRGDAAFAASFKEPAAQAHLHEFYLQGMAVARHHTAPGAPGRLVAAFAHPDSYFQNGVPQPRAHTLVQWDTTSLQPEAGQEGLDELATLPLLDPAPDARLLQPCAGASMVSAAAAFNSEGDLQWGILATARAHYLGCQTAEGAGAVVEVALGADGALSPEAAIRTFPLSKRTSDVLVDPGGERLLFTAVEAAGNPGATVWAFDARKGRFTGAVALRQTIGVADALGLDPTTGRLYVLMPDHDAQDAKGRRFPVRGGLQVADTRLDPVPSLENMAPELAYPTMWRIAVDPPTRRVFVRWGHGQFGVRAIYPGTEQTTLAPPEPFYRVLRDLTPVREQPAEADDSAFTTDVAEDPALTRASYLGSAQGYGARSLLVGGLDAATSGATGPSPCGKDDREALAGSVGQVSVSDLAVAAEASSLDGDARTRAVLSSPASRCASPSAGAADQALDDEAALDADGDGANRHRAACVASSGRIADEPPVVERRLKRDGFRSKAVCDRDSDAGEGEAEGALTGPTTAGGVRVGRATSTVTVVRKAGRGVVARVDSVARDVEIPGVGTIGIVRAEATSSATGRTRRAGGSFRRWICGVELTGESTPPGCLSEDQQRWLVERLNERLSGRGRARLRDPDPVLLAGSPSGYRSAAQRAAEDLFEDRNISKDASAAVPGLELVFFQGDGDSRWGTGRQILQMAGAQAASSYGIACLYGRRTDGACATEGTAPADLAPPFGPEPETDGSGAGPVAFDDVAGGDESLALPGLPLPPGRESRLLTVLRAPVRALAQALRLLFNNPRELGLLAAVWLLLYLPFHLTGRRRAVGALAARRLTLGVTP